MRGRYLALYSLLAISNVVLGCTTDSTSTTAAATVDPPTMELVSPAEGACIAIGTDPNVSIPFVLKTSSLYLRPPGICGDAVQCGQLVLWVNDKQVQRASTSVIEWDLVTTVERYGDFAIRIEAVTDAGKSILDADGKPLEVNRVITTAETCLANP
jgi:hypothetical protein